MISKQGYLWHRLTPVWLGGLIGLFAGAALLLLGLPAYFQPPGKMIVPAHDIYGGYHPFDLRRIPFLMPFIGLFVGLLFKMYRDAVGRHRHTWSSGYSDRNAD
jgi:hypothetical protein